MHDYNPLVFNRNHNNLVYSNIKPRVSNPYLIRVAVPGSTPDGFYRNAYSWTSTTGVSNMDPRTGNPYSWTSTTSVNDRRPNTNNPYSWTSTTGTSNNAPSIDNPFSWVFNSGTSNQGVNGSNPYSNTTGNNGTQNPSTTNPFNQFSSSQGRGDQQHLNESVEIPAKDYKVKAIDLSNTSDNLDQVKISSLENTSLVDYVKAINGYDDYKKLLADEIQKVKNGTADDNTAKLGFFREYLYQELLDKSLFGSNLSPGERRYHYELLSQAMSNTLGVDDKNNPMNIEMEKAIIPEMMKLMARDGYKVIIDDGTTKTEYSGNNPNANPDKEFVIKLDSEMGWRTQIGNNTFSQYAQKAIRNMQDSNKDHNYTNMYETVVLKRRKEFEDNSEKLKGKKDETISALRTSSGSRSDTQKSLINDGITVVEGILTNDMKYQDSNFALTKAGRVLGEDENAASALILYLVSSSPIEYTDSSGKKVTVNSSNIFKNDGSNQPFINNPEVQAKLLERLENLKSEVN